jgi:ankyrin repeat protein
VSRLLKIPNININSVDDHGRTAIWYAAAGGHLQSVKLLIEHPYLNIALQDSQGKSAQDIAKDRGYWRIISLL